MRELGEAAGVSKAAIYYHFRDKEALFAALLEQSLAQLEQIILLAVEQNPDNPRVQVERVVTAILGLPVEERAMIRVAMQEMGHMSVEAQVQFLAQYRRRFLGRLDELFRQGIEKGHFRQLEPATATWTLLGIMYPHFLPGPKMAETAVGSGAKPTDPPNAGYAAQESVGARKAGQATPIDQMLLIFFHGLCEDSAEANSAENASAEDEPGEGERPPL